MLSSSLWCLNHSAPGSSMVHQYTTISHYCIRIQELNVIILIKHAPFPFQRPWISYSLFVMPQPRKCVVAYNVLMPWLPDGLLSSSMNSNLLQNFWSMLLCSYVLWFLSTTWNINVVWEGEIILGWFESITVPWGTWYCDREVRPSPLNTPHEKVRDGEPHSPLPRLYCLQQRSTMET
jgi:hypothetical protein